MRNPVWRIDGAGANALEGTVVWAPAKSMWNSLMFAVALGLGWWVKGAAVQASNLPGWSLLTHGECWHNNHHAFPESANMALEAGQFDPGYQVLLLLQRCGLVSNIGVPRPDNRCEDLIANQLTPSVVRGRVVYLPGQPII
jgi:fatty-acid desaturase